MSLQWQLTKRVDDYRNVLHLINIELCVLVIQDLALLKPLIEAEESLELAAIVTLWTKSF
jgi:hypothetical protein